MSERSQCVEILEQILEQKIFYNNIKADIDEKNTAFCNIVVLNALRHLTGLEKTIKQFLIKKIPQKNRILRYILLSALTEIMFLNSPEYAIINEYVNIAKKKTDKFAANMVNAVLRKIVAQKQNLLSEPQLPEHFLKILNQDYSKLQIKKISQSAMCEAPLDLSIKENHEFWAKELGGMLFSNGTVRIHNAKTKISNLKGYNDGMWWVQDLAASLPVMLLGDVSNKKVLDLCAAPGGKTAQLLAKGAKVTAVDIDNKRMEKLKQNMARLHLSENLETVVADGLDFLQNNRNVFDIIVLDAPCSATGTFRKHPEVLHFKTMQDVLKQVDIQEKLLFSAIRALKPQGLILYCTCSISKHEGEYIIEKVLTEHNNIKLLNADIKKINVFEGKNLSNDIINNGVLRTLSYYEENYGGMDSFFAACLQKNN